MLKKIKTLSLILGAFVISSISFGSVSSSNLNLDAVATQLNGHYSGLYEITSSDSNFILHRSSVTSSFKKEVEDFVNKFSGTSERKFCVTKANGFLREFGNTVEYTEISIPTPLYNKLHSDTRGRVECFRISFRLIQEVN